MTDWTSDFAQYAREELPAESAKRLIGLPNWKRGADFAAQALFGGWCHVR
ncbi:hypothetical protein ACQP25_23665 [Microtetraspora malaysiensis]